MVACKHTKNDWIFYLLLVPILFLAVPYIRALTESYSHLEQARSFKVNGQYQEAIESYRVASSFYAPGNSWAIVAADELYELANTSEKAEVRIEALRELRSSFISSDFGWNIFDNRSGDFFKQIEADLEVQQGIDIKNRPGRNIAGFGSAVMFLFWIVSIVLMIKKLKPGSYKLAIKNNKVLVLSILISFVGWLTLLKLA